MAIATINPATGETVKTFEPLSEHEVDERLALAAAEFTDLPDHRFRAAGGLDAEPPPTCWRRSRSGGPA